jgi:hypothetical protein
MHERARDFAARIRVLVNAGAMIGGMSEEELKARAAELVAVMCDRGWASEVSTDYVSGRIVKMTPEPHWVMAWVRVDPDCYWVGGETNILANEDACVRCTTIDEVISEAVSYGIPF